VAVTKRFRVLVTLRDMRGKYVRSAIVSVSRVPGAVSRTSGVGSAFSNKSGQATIVAPVTESMLGKRLFLKIGARTPSARAIAVRSLRLPALAWPEPRRHASPGEGRRCAAAAAFSSLDRRRDAKVLTLAK
jgi:hypothetical protein